MRALLFAAALLLASCAAPSRAQKVQEAAFELNSGLRFGYTAMALEKVAAAERHAFTKRHKGWHNRLKIVDFDLAGMAVREGGDADVFVAISWHRAEESDVRSTIIHQRWKDHSGSWLLVSEVRSQGDSGLLGEEPDAKAPGDDDPGQRNSSGNERQFRTTVIR